MNQEYDVTVIGGGTAGIIAALQSSRAGAKTILIEKTSILGGTMTNGGIAYPGLFYAWGEQIIAGIGWELVVKAVEEAGGELPDFTDDERHHACRQVVLEPHIYASLADELLIKSGCEIRFHTMLAEATANDQGWDLKICGKTGLQEIKTRQLIDCTGDGNAAQIAGAELRIIENSQPATLSCVVSGYDMNELDFDSINAAFEEEVKKGRLVHTDVGWSVPGNVRGWLGKHGNNANHYPAPKAHTSEGRSNLEIRSRKAFLQLYRFLKKQPGLENLKVDELCPECGVRETATVVGDYTITAEDYLSGRKFDDAVCNAFYSIDLHLFGTKAHDKPIEFRRLEKGIVPTVPRAALLPKGLENITVAGRCLSSDREANSALRVEAPCMATGQAAGALAALSVLQNTTPRKVPMEKLREMLKKHRAIVP